MQHISQFRMQHMHIRDALFRDALFRDAHSLYTFRDALFRDASNASFLMSSTYLLPLDSRTYGEQNVPLLHLPTV